MLYFDHAASSPLCSEALEVLNKSMLEDFVNPSAAHKWGKDLKEKTDQIRNDFLKRLKAPKGSRFIFTGSASESNNTVIKGMNLKEGDAVYVSLGDHASMVKPVLHLKDKGIKILELPLNEVGVPDVSLLPEELDKDAKLMLISSVNSQSGGFMDIENFACALKKKSPHIHLHVDAVQALGKFPISLENGCVDSLAVAAQKMGGPKGVAGLYLGKDVAVVPLIHGGNQEPEVRSSTIAFPMIAAFHKAFEVAEDQRDEVFERVKNLRAKLVQGINKIDEKIEFPFDLEHCSPYIISLLWKGISSDIVLRHLEQKDVAIASTSACSSKIKGDNPTMAALGLPNNVHKFVLRVSIGKSTTDAEVDGFLEKFSEVHSELQMFIKR